MKNIFKYLGFLVLATVVLWSCENEWEAPTAEPNHAYITTSFGGVTNRLQINDAMTFIDLSRGVETRTWTFPAGVTDTAYNAISSSVEQSVKVRFVNTGDHMVKLSQTYAGDVYLGYSSTPSGSAAYDTTIMVTVVDSVRANFVAKRMEDMSVLNHAANALNEVVAGREVEFSFEGTGEPTDFTWTITRNDGFTTTTTGNPAVVKFSSLGDYSVKVSASSDLGGDIFELENYITVIPSTDPVDLLEVVRGEMNQIGLVFSRDMQDPFNCNPEAFTLSVTNGNKDIPVNITGFTRDQTQNNIVLIELNDNIYNSDKVEVSYNAELGNLTTTDLMEATSFENKMVDFKVVNVMATYGYDVGIETSTNADWPYLWWGGVWGEYTSEVSSTQAHRGNNSLYIDMKPMGGAIFEHRQNETTMTFPVEAKLYEVGVWVYMEELGNADTGDGLVPDLRFYPNNWSAEMAYFFTPEFTQGEWVYMSADWNCTTPGDLSFFIRGYNASSTVSTKFYMDDLIIFEKEVRP